MFLFKYPLVLTFAIVVGILIFTIISILAYTKKKEPFSANFEEQHNVLPFPQPPQKEHPKPYSAPPPLKSIFVAYPSFMQPPENVSCIFASAEEPSRVYVGIYEQGWPNYSRKLFQKFHRLGQIHLLPNVRIKRGSMETALGASVARQVIMNHLYSDEDFILFVHGGHSQFLPNWDRTLLVSISKTHRLGGHLISQFPIEKNEKKRIQKKGGDLSGEGGGVVLDGCRGMLEDFQINRSGGLPSTFPVFSEFAGEQSVPVFSGQKFSEVDAPPSPVTQVGVASYRCLFGSREVIVKYLNLCEPGVPFLRSDESDWLLSLLLWARGMNVYTPTRSALVHLKNKNSEDRKRSFECVRSRSLTRARLRLLDYFTVNRLPYPTKRRFRFLQKYELGNLKHPWAFHEWIGLDLPGRQASGRAVLGLLPGFTKEDILNKYGSETRFQQLRNRFV